MTANSKIEWTDHTFNPWWGCQKVGPGCDHCYAETLDKRTGGGHWGPGAERRRTSIKNWNDPVRWNKQHEAFFGKAGRRQRVFCASMADVFDNAVDPAWRRDLFDLIELTPNLDWLLLTKRIGNVAEMVSRVKSHDWLAGQRNVWLGATVVNQEEADRDIPKLLAVPAHKRFLSMEPLLGSVDIAKWLDPWTCSNCGHHGSQAESGPCRCDDCGVLTAYDPSAGSDRCPVCKKTDCAVSFIGDTCPVCERAGNWGMDNGFQFDLEKKLIDWVIAGGESGPSARPMHPDWARSLRDQCAAAGVPFLFKQWGEWLPISHMSSEDSRALYRSRVKAKPHEDQEALDDGYGRDCTVQTGVIHSDGSLHAIAATMAFQQGTGAMQTFKVGKKAAGRLLDGITHDGFPA